MGEDTRISVYPVGIMSTLLALRHRGNLNRWHLKRLVTGWRSKAFWDGYHAEVDYPPAGLRHSRVGVGWTRKGAARDLGLQLWKDNH